MKVLKKSLEWPCCQLDHDHQQLCRNLPRPMAEASQQMVLASWRMPARP